MNTFRFPCVFVPPVLGTTSQHLHLPRRLRDMFDERGGVTTDGVTIYESFFFICLSTFFPPS